jgi:hypothetical protein
MRPQAIATWSMCSSALRSQGRSSSQADIDYLGIVIDLYEPRRGYIATSTLSGAGSVYRFQRERVGLRAAFVRAALLSMAPTAWSNRSVRLVLPASAWARTPRSTVLVADFSYLIAWLTRTLDPAGAEPLAGRELPTRPGRRDHLSHPEPRAPAQFAQDGVDRGHHPRRVASAALHDRRFDCTPGHLTDQHDDLPHRHPAAAPDVEGQPHGVRGQLPRRRHVRGS